jgi:glutamate formiminotransferase
LHQVLSHPSNPVVHLIQCVPNFSEGRDPAVIAALVEAVRETPGVALVDYSADPDHHRCVLTFIGRARAVQAAALATARQAVALIDLTQHVGAHPRIGALDVLPFVPLGETPIVECVDLARETGLLLADELNVPVFLYEAAATTPERRDLALVRGRGFEALREAMHAGERVPDFGPGVIHPTAGAVAVGARGPLTAYNIVLDTDDLAVAKEIAHRIRERDGGLLSVKALGLWLPSRERAQVSINITRPLETPIWLVYEAVREAAAGYGISVLESEVIGAIRLEELVEATRHFLKLPGLDRRRVLDLWAAHLGSEDEEIDGEG